MSPLYIKITIVILLWKIYKYSGFESFYIMFLWNYGSRAVNIQNKVQGVPVYKSVIFIVVLLLWIDRSVVGGSNPTAGRPLISYICGEDWHRLCGYSRVEKRWLEWMSDIDTSWCLTMPLINEILQVSFIPGLMGSGT